MNTVDETQFPYDIDIQNLRFSSTVNPLLRGLFFFKHFGGGAGGGGLFNLAKCINGSKVSRGRTCGHPGAMLLSPTIRKR